MKKAVNHSGPLMEALPLVLFGLVLIAGTTSGTQQVTFSFKENTGPDYSVGRVTEEQGTDFRFSGGSSFCLQNFSIVSGTGEILTRTNIDREFLIQEIDDETLSCSVTYSRNGQDTVVQVNFHVLDVNDFTPYFSGMSRPVDTRKVYENVQVGQVIAYLMPFDLDAGLNGTVNFTISYGNEGQYFNVSLPAGQTDTHDRLIILNQKLDYTTHPQYNLTLSLSDGGSPPLTSTQYLVINIIDVNDQAPAFAEEKLSFNVSEDHPVGSSYPFAVIGATDDDSPTHSQIFYQLDLDGSTDAYAIANLLAVNTTSGELYLLDRLQYDGNSKHSYKFQVEARNPGTVIGTKAIVTLNVTDANDEVPLLNCHPTEISVSENSSAFSIFCQFEDNDEAPQDKALGKVDIISSPIKLDYNIDITHLSVNSLYLINIAFNSSIDREETPSININITASDSGIIPLSSSQVISITVLDVNDNSPQFTTTGVSSKISISSQPPLAIASVHATDPDEGRNSTLRYSLTSIEPATATDWFIINNDTGLITLVEAPTEGVTDVYITVTCSDKGYPTPKHNSTIVTVHITQPVTYRPISYQQYNNINVASSNVVYIEFHTISSSGLLLYQSHSTVKDVLWISNETVLYNDWLIRSSVSIERGRWYSLLLNKTEGTLLVWERGSDSSHSVAEILETSRVRDCSDQGSTPNSHPLFIGGVPNAFNILPSLLASSDFIGSISAVVIGNQHLDLSCPYSSRNTLQGYHYNSQCLDADLCSDWSDCVPYSPSGSSPCHCTNGLPAETCDTEQDYGPIAITNGSFIQFSLDYNFFYSQSKSEHNQEQETQSISISFIHNMTRVSGVILYSETSDGFIQRLEINKTIRYTVTQYQMPKLSLITEEFSFRKGMEYTLELILAPTANDMRIKVTEKDSNIPGQYLEVTTKNFSHQGEFYSFAKEPVTVVSLGGLSSLKGGVYQGHYTGCITEFKIDSVPLPLVGITTSNSLNFTSKEGLEPFCHSCFMYNTCTSHSTCTPVDQTDYQCKCVNGYNMINDTCVQVLSTVPSPSSSVPATIRPSNIPWTGGVEDSTEGSGLKLYYIISISGSLVVLIALLLVVMAVVFRCAYKRGRKEREEEGQTHPNHHGNGCYNETIPSDKGNSISLKRGNNYVKTSILKNHRQSSTDDIDSSSDMTPYTFGCRKSTSQETGFHTASEPEGPSSRSSPRRESMMSKESERYSSDFTSLETDSEDLTTSGIDEIMSPNEVRMVSSGSMMGVPSSFRLQHPLTPTEKNLLKPLQPNPKPSPLILSEDETDTEVSTSSPRRRDPPTGRYYEGRGYFDNDSLASNQNSPKWYKTSSPSTIIDSDSDSINNGLLSGSLTRLSSFPKGGRANKHKSHRPPNLLPHVRPHKGTSPHHSPFVSSPGYSSSPLVKSHRLTFDYPSMATSAITPAPPTYHPPHGLYYEHTEARLPSIAESVQYQPRPYHPRPHEHIDPYYPGYQGVALTPGGVAPTAYCDLNSFSKVNPITYWEGQQRLHPIVDQEDPLRFLREPCRKFEDVSTTPSVAESGFTESVVADRDSTISEPQGRVRPGTSRGVHNDYVVMPRTLPPHPTNEEETGYHDNNQRPYMEERRGYHSNDDQISYHDNVHIVDRRGYHSDDAGLNGYHGNMNGAREEEITHFPSADCTSTLATNTLATSVPPVTLSNGSERQY